MIRYLVTFLTMLTLLIIVFCYQCFGACSQNDDFTGANGSAPDATKWTETDTGVMDIQTNTLYFDSTTPGTDLTSSVASKWLIPAGDFDIQVDFGADHLPDPIASANIAAALRVYNEDSSKAVNIGRAHDGSLESNKDGYFSYSTDDAWAMVGDYVDATGKLRLTRVGATIKGYWWNAGWEWDGNGAGYTFTTSWVGAASVLLWFKIEINSTMQSYMDNFVITKGCPAVGFIGPKLMTITKNGRIK